MVKKYELPNEMLQLIGGAPDLDFGMQQQSGAAQFATPDVRRSDLISALRNISGPANPGFTRYANQANGAALSPTARKTLNVISPARLTLSKYIAPDVVLPGGEPPYVPPYVPPFVDKVIFNDVIDDKIVDDGDILDDPVEDVGTEIIDDGIVLDDIVEDVGTEIIDNDFDGLDLDDVVIPEEKEKTGIVDIEVVDGLEAQDDGTTDGILDLINAGFDNSEKTGTVDIEVVDGLEAQDDGTTGDILDLINSGLPGDQDDFIQDDGTTDGIQDIIDSIGDGPEGSGGEDDYFDSYDFGNDFGYDFGYDFGGGGGGGGGKFVDDYSGGVMAFAKGGKVTPNRLAGPNPPGPDDGFAALKNGEFVLNKEAAEAIGYELLNRLNRTRP